MCNLCNVYNKKEKNNPKPTGIVGGCTSVRPKTQELRGCCARRFSGDGYDGQFGRPSPRKDAMRSGKQNLGLPAVSIWDVLDLLIWFLGHFYRNIWNHWLWILELKTGGALAGGKEGPQKENMYSTVYMNKYTVSICIYCWVYTGKYGESRESRVLEWHGCQTYRIVSTPAMFPSDNGHCWAMLGLR